MNKPWPARTLKCFSQVNKSVLVNWWYRVTLQKDYYTLFPRLEYDALFSPQVEMWACLLSFLLVTQWRRVFTPPAKKTAGTNSSVLSWRNTLLPVNSAGVGPVSDRETGGGSDLVSETQFSLQPARGRGNSFIWILSCFLNNFPFGLDGIFINWKV